MLYSVKRFLSYLKRKFKKVPEIDWDEGCIMRDPWFWDLFDSDGNVKCSKESDKEMERFGIPISYVCPISNNKNNDNISKNEEI